jgi:uncharacterized pyridoxal phosphate-containing UPF0001 family protein
MSFAENLAAVQGRIAAACERARRDPAEVTLVAVSKNHPAESVAAAVAMGVTLFGENRVQEAKAKIPASPAKARWHFIGHLQSNKARDAATLFEMIESVDSLALAAELQKQAEKQAKKAAAKEKKDAESLNKQVGANSTKSSPPVTEWRVRGPLAGATRAIDSERTGSLAAVRP